MKTVRLDDSIFDELAATTGRDLISIFIPTHRRGRDVAQDRIRLKNQLSEVEDQLGALGWRPRDRSERLARAEALLDDRQFWEHQDEGLAVYVWDDGEITPISTSHSLEATSTIMPVFLLRPLLGELDVIPALVLALTRDEVALFTATKRSVERMDTDLPSFDDVNWFVDRETQRQQHPDRVGTSRNRHGHDPSDRSGEDLKRFLREVSAAVPDTHRATPLVVLGDDDLVARFASLSERSTITPDNSGLSAPFSNDEVRQMTGALLADLARERSEASIAEAAEQIGIGNATRDVAEALPAAVSGRVGKVVVDRRAAPVWGRLDKSSLEVGTSQEKRPGDVDLIDRLVIESRAHGAEVVSVESGIEASALVAIYRF
ncbi:MAG: hypothetical protein ACRDU9_08560 [Acidimicrobiia bacterium]